MKKIVIIKPQYSEQVKYFITEVDTDLLSESQEIIRNIDNSLHENHLGGVVSIKTLEGNAILDDKNNFIEKFLKNDEEIVSITSKQYMDILKNNNITTSYDQCFTEYGSGGIWVTFMSDDYFEDSQFIDNSEILNL